jgi:predicted DsbA family dithiol-disulfide isomerase
MRILLDYYHERNYIMTNQVQKTCTMCKETKPKAEFKRRLTLAQSAHYLRRASVSVRTSVISVRCKDCWKLSKRKTPLTAKQIQNKVVSGDMHPVVAEITLRKRKEELPKIRSRIMKEYWWGKKTNYLKQLNANLQKQVSTYGNRYRNTKSKLKASLEKHETTHHALLEQHSKNYTLAKQIKKDLMARAREGEVIDLDTKLMTLMKKG